MNEEKKGQVDSALDDLRARHERVLTEKEEKENDEDDATPTQSPGKIAETLKDLGERTEPLPDETEETKYRPKRGVIVEAQEPKDDTEGS